MAYVPRATQQLEPAPIAARYATVTYRRAAGGIAVGPVAPTHEVQYLQHSEHMQPAQGPVSPTAELLQPQTPSPSTASQLQVPSRGPDAVERSPVVSSPMQSQFVPPSPLPTAAAPRKPPSAMETQARFSSFLRDHVWLDAVHGRVESFRYVLHVHPHLQLRSITDFLNHLPTPPDLQHLSRTVLSVPMSPKEAEQYRFVSCWHSMLTILSPCSRVGFGLLCACSAFVRRCVLGEFAELQAVDADTVASRSCPFLAVML